MNQILPIPSGLTNTDVLSPSFSFFATYLGQRRLGLAQTAHSTASVIDILRCLIERKKELVFVVDEIEDHIAALDISLRTRTGLPKPWVQEKRKSSAEFVDSHDAAAVVAYFGGMWPRPDDVISWMRYILLESKVELVRSMTNDERVAQDVGRLFFEALELHQLLGNGLAPSHVPEGALGTTIVRLVEKKAEGCDPTRDIVVVLTALSDEVFDRHQLDVEPLVESAAFEFFGRGNGPQSGPSLA